MRKSVLLVMVTLGLMGLLAMGLMAVLGLVASKKSEETAQNVLVPSQVLLPVGRMSEQAVTAKASPVPDFATLWVTNFEANEVLAFNRAGQKVWQQSMQSPPIPPKSYNTHTEYVTVAANGNLIVSDGEGMMVQEIDRVTHKLIWQYGVKDKQSSAPGYLHQPDKAYKINDHEVIINDGNNRRVIIVDQQTNQIVWQYGQTLRMGTTPGLLNANTCVVPLNDHEFIITDTLQKKILIVDRTSKQITWQWTKPDAKWIQHVWPTNEGTLVMEDRQKNEVFEVNRDGQILWTLNKLADGSTLKYPTDVIKLSGGHVLIGEADRGRVIEVVPQTGEVIREYKGAGFVTTIAIDPAAV